MSAEDVWQLKIPIRLTLAQDEISSPGDVKPIYVLAPRFAYLPALAQQCLSFFQHVLLNLPGQATSSSSPWFEYEGLALNWTQPLGVLHDLLTPQPPQQQQQAAVAAGFSTTAIPWCLTVHYRNQPATLNNTWQNSGTAKDYFFSSLKEAGYCCRGTDGCNAVMRLPGPMQDDVWAAVNRGDAAVVRQHTSPLRLSPTQRQGSSIPTVPVRLYIRRHKAGDSAAGVIGLWAEVYSSSRAMEVQQPDGSSTLLAHLVHGVMPQRFPAPQQQGATAQADAGSSSKQLKQQTGGGANQQAVDPQEQQSAAAGSINDTAGGQAQPPQQLQQQQQLQSGSDPLGVLATSHSRAAAGDEPPTQTSAESAAAVGERQGCPSPDASTAASATGCVLLPDWPSVCAAYVCGIQPDWCTPLGWLHANLKAADGFLYVVVHLGGAAS